MAVESSIIDTLEQQASIFNQTEGGPTKVEVRVPEGANPGRGNSDFGRHCIYEVYVVAESQPHREAKLFKVFHPDGIPSPLTVTITESGQKIENIPENYLGQQVKNILASEGTNKIRQNLAGS